MGPKEYKGMMDYLTGPRMARGGRVGFAQGTPQRLSLINNLKSAIAQAEKTNNYNLLKLARRDTGGILSDQTAKFLNKAANDKNYAKSFAKELNISTKKLESILDKRATAIREFGRKTSQESSLKRVSPKKRKMIELINEGVNDTSLLAKQLKISKAEVNKIGNALYKDIYASSQALGKGATRELGGGLATFLPDNAKDLNSLLKKMHNVKGLETVEQRQIKKILGEVFGGGKNRKLFKLYNDKINEYYDIKKQLTGKINLNLDHPLSAQMIKNLKLGKEAMLYVQPLTAEINQGVKSLLEKSYATAFASKSPDRTSKMNKIVNLAKKIELPMGTTKLISEPFYKQDIPKKVIEAAKTQNRVLKNIQNLSPEEIRNVFPDKRSKLISSDIKPIDVKEITNFFKSKGIKLNAASIPVITDILKMAESIPGDIAKKSYFKAAGKAAGLAFTPVMLYDTYKALEQGKPLLESLEQGLIGTNIIGGTKDILALTPEERTARSVVKQDALKDLNLEMPMGFGFIEGPTPKTDMTLQDAQQKMEKGIQRVQSERAQKESDIAANRASFFGNIRDKVFGIGQDYQLKLAGGGIAGLSGGIDKGPQRRSMNPDSQGLSGILKRGIKT